MDELTALRRLWEYLEGELLSDDAYDLDGFDMLDMAEALGLVKSVPYNPDVHGEMECEPGDIIRVPSGLAKRP